MRYNPNANNFNEDSSKLIISFMCTIDLIISDNQVIISYFQYFISNSIFGYICTYISLTYPPTSPNLCVVRGFLIYLFFLLTVCTYESLVLKCFKFASISELSKFILDVGEI